MLKHKIINYLRWKIYGDFPRLSYSRSGEDCVLKEYFSNTINGFYVDIGCYHPFVSNNTAIFYQSGWNGINVDANKRAIEMFDKVRSRDINVHCGIDLEPGVKKYFRFKEKGFDQMNTISEEFKHFAVAEFNLTVESEIEIKTMTLEELFEQNLPKNKEISFMSVDVEGKDLEVLKSNNWNKYRPLMIVVEITGGICDIESNEITVLLKNCGYKPVAFTPINSDRGNIFFRVF